MTQKHDDTCDLMTNDACKERRESSWKVIGVLVTVLTLIGTAAFAIAGSYVVPALSEGYKVQVNLDLYIKEQDAFKKLILEKVLVTGAKVETIGTEVTTIGTKVQVIGSQVEMIGNKVNAFGDRFDKIEAKFNTSWGHDSDHLKSLEAIMKLLNDKSLGHQDSTP